jgi:NADH-quinone oxidoreductase subunit J
MLDSVFFYFFAGVAILSAALMVTRSNAIHSGILLITTLLATAGIFLQLRADFLFIAQIILYAVGIMVLFLFALVRLRLHVSVGQIKFSRQKYVGSLVALALAFQVGILLWSSRQIPGDGLLIQGAAPAEKLPPNTQELSRILFSGYLLPFEVASVLLLVSMIGAVLMVRRRSASE